MGQTITRNQILILDRLRNSSVHVAALRGACREAAPTILTTDWSLLGLNLISSKAFTRPIPSVSIHSYPHRSFMHLFICGVSILN